MTTLINKRTLLAMIPLSEKAIYNMEQRGEFPRRIALTSRNVAWDLADVEAWIADRKACGQPAKRPGKQSPQPAGEATEILASQPAKVVGLRR
jgi:prophage regulatory protein